MSESESGIVLGANQYGKAEVRLVRIDRDRPRHSITDLDVTSQLRGDFTAAHTEGDNARIVATDTQKNTVFAFARDGVGAPEEFLLRLGRHFTGEFAWVTGGRWEAEQYTWNRIPVDGEGHDHSFVRGGTEVRTAVVTFVGAEATVISGLRDLAVLKSAGSEFRGFVRDRYTTLAETDDRLLATSVTARWRYGSPDVGFDDVFADVRRLLLETFARTHSLALQQTLYEMGRRVLEARAEIDEIRFSMPNLHHFAVDLAPFGLDNPNEVFYAADRPYGLIEAAVLREGVSGNHQAWHGIAGFC
ncbi:factor-independent urate hydroxylase [Microbacterium sp. NPDC056044]|uniref:factor-independent urate hydroxylase n=1 Tax=Microbacterium sp. NPDC056044 TaxID=3345690 RepID=UPI0035D71B59